MRFGDREHLNWLREQEEVAMEMIPFKTLLLQWAGRDAVWAERDIISADEVQSVRYTRQQEAAHVREPEHRAEAWSMASGWVPPVAA